MADKSKISENVTDNISDSDRKRRSLLFLFLAVLALLYYTWLAGPTCDSDTPTVWLTELPACPCEMPEATNSTDGWGLDVGDLTSFHPGAQACFRSYPPVETEVGKSAQQCCYDEAGKLITGGTAAGTPDRVSVCAGEDEAGEMEVRILGLYGHFREDVVPFQRFGWKAYNECWTPDNGAGCEENSVGE